MNDTMSFRPSHKSREIIDSELKNPNKTITEAINEIIEINPKGLAHEFQESTFRLSRALSDSIANAKRADELNSEVLSLRAKIAEISKSNGDKEINLVEMESLTNKVRNLESELQRTKEGHIKIENEKDILSEELDQHRFDIEELRLDNKSLKQSTKTEDLETKIEELTDELATSNSENERLSDLLADYDTDEFNEVFEMVEMETFKTDSDGQSFYIIEKKDLVEMLIHQFKLHLEGMKKDEDEDEDEDED